MKYMDYHIHTNFSPDSNEEPENVVKRGIELGLKEIAITDHFEFDVIEDPNQEWQIKDIDRYLNTLKELKEKYSKDIELKLGIETGIQPHSGGFYKDLINKYPFDFVIGSSHVVERHDLYLGSVQKNRTKKEVQELYFQTVLDSIKENNDYNVYGHLDFVTRYGGPEYKGLDPKEFTDILDSIFKELIHKGKGIEINSSGFRYGEDRFYPQYDILKQYVDMGGEIITIGSDSHRAIDMGKDFDKVYAALEKLGVKYVTTFSERKPNFIKIK